MNAKVAYQLCELSDVVWGVKPINALLISPFYPFPELFIQVFFEYIHFFVTIPSRELFEGDWVNVEEDIIKELFLLDLSEGDKAT